MAQVLRALGCMSGTSLDGVDAAVIETDGTRVSGFGPTAYRPYSEAEQAVLRAGLGHWDGPEVAAAAEVVETAHAELLARFRDVDVVGFHGQTLAHDPGGRGTLQVGNGAVLAEFLGLPVVWDFRTADVKMGGQGAPLAPFYHHALARRLGGDAPVAFLNLGGVGNITFCDPSLDDPTAPGALLALDTGPANAPINDLVRARRGLTHDAGGRLALSGKVDASVLDLFSSHPWFLRVPPKSLDRNSFEALPRMVDRLSDADAAATLVAIAAMSVGKSLEFAPVPPRIVYVTGGGRLNPALMQRLAEELPIPVRPIEDAGFDGDMLEAQAFAYLAVRVMQGRPTSCPTTTGVPALVGGGEISRPVGSGLRLMS